MNTNFFFPLYLLLFINLAISPSSFGQSEIEKSDELQNLIDKMESWTYTNVDSSQYYACQLLDMAIHYHDSLAIATAYTGIAYSYLYQHKLPDALSYLIISDAIYNKVGDSLDISETHLNFGNVYTEMGFFEKGIEHYLMAESYLPKNIEWRDYNLAYIYFNTSETFLDLDDFKNSLKYIQLAEDCAVRGNSDELIHAIHNIKAHIFLSKQKYAEARTHAELALSKARQFQDLNEQSRALGILALVFSQEGYHEKAINYQKQALDKAEKFGDPLEISTQYSNLATILLSAGQKEQALPPAQKAHSLAMQIQSKVLTMNTCKVMGMVLEANEKYNMALMAYKEYYAYRDTISKVNITERLLHTENKIQSQQAELLQARNAIQQQIIKKDRMVMIGFGVAFLLVFALVIVLLKSLRRKRLAQQEIEEKQKLLNAKSEELNRTNKSLEQLNEGKDKLFSILAHDLKQPFNQTLQLLELLELQMAGDEDLQQLTKQVKETVEDTKGTVDNLLAWSKSQFANLKTEAQAVSIEPIATELQADFKKALSQKKLKAEIKIEANLRVWADPYHLEIILRNLLQNAIKFSNTGGTIELRAAKKGDQIFIEVSDQGIGMKKDQLKNLFDANTHFSTPGTLNEKGTGLGMLIVNDFVKENDGKLEIESEPNQGSTFRIILPVA